MQEYFARQRMKELGFGTSFEELDELTAKAFMVISQEIDKERERQRKRGR